MNSKASPAPFRFHVGRAAIIGACVMVCVTGFTTGSGLLDIVGFRYLFIVIMATIAIQLMLAISAWFLGQELARYVLRNTLGPGIEPPSAPLTAVTGFVFLATFLVSFFFAFSFWYTQFRSLSQLGEEARNIPNSFQISVTTPLREAVKEKREAELRNPEKDSVVGPWLAGIEAVIAATQGEGRQAIEDRLTRIDQAASSQQARVVAAAKQRTLDAQQAAIELEKQVKLRNANEARVVEIQSRLKPIDEVVDQLRSQKNDFDAEYLRECSGADGRKGGCGTKANTAKTRSQKIVNEISKIEATAKKDRDQLVTLENSIDDAKVKIGDLSAKAAATASSVAEPASGTQAPASPFAERGVDGAIQALRDRKRDFLANGTLAAYEATAKACSTLLQTLSEAKTAANPSGSAAVASCESSGVVQQTQTRPQREAARANFEINCSPEAMSQTAAAASRLIPHGRSGVDRDILGQSFDLINSKIQSCISFAAATGADVTAIEERRAKFAIDKAPDRDRFDQAWNGLWEGGGHRTGAVVLAAVFDLMILGLSFFADLFNIRGHAKAAAPTIRRIDLDLIPNDDDPIPLAGAKALRRLARYDVKLRRSAIDPNGPDVHDLKPPVRDQLRLHLDSLLQNGRAEQIKDGRVALSEAALEDLEVFLHARSEPASALKTTSGHSRAEPPLGQAAVSTAAAVSHGGNSAAHGAAGTIHPPASPRPRPSDIGSRNWKAPKRPVQNDNDAAEIQASASPDRKASPSGTADAPSMPDEDALGLADLMNRQR